MIDKIVARKKGFDIYEYDTDRMFSITREEFGKLNRAMRESNILYYAESRKSKTFKWGKEDVN